MIEGPALVLAHPLSLWGGIDVETGRIIDRAHPDAGVSISGTILFMPGGRGSSSSSSILAESLRRGTGPLAIVLTTLDPILVVGSIVAEALYGVQCPIVVGAADRIASGTRLCVTAGGDGHATIVIVPTR